MPVTIDTKLFFNYNTDKLSDLFMQTTEREKLSFLKRQIGKKNWYTIVDFYIFKPTETIQQNDLELLEILNCIMIDTLCITNCVDLFNISEEKVDSITSKLFNLLNHFLVYHSKIEESKLDLDYKSDFFRKIGFYNFKFLILFILQNYYEYFSNLYGHESKKNKNLINESINAEINTYYQSIFSKKQDESLKINIHHGNINKILLYLKSKYHLILSDLESNNQKLIDDVQICYHIFVDYLLKKIPCHYSRDPIDGINSKSLIRSIYIEHISKSTGLLYQFFETELTNDKNSLEEIYELIEITQYNLLKNIFLYNDAKANLSKSPSEVLLTSARLTFLEKKCLLSVLDYRHAITMLGKLVAKENKLSESSKPAMPKKLNLHLGFYIALENSMLQHEAVTYFISIGENHGNFTQDKLYPFTSAVEILMNTFSPSSPVPVFTGATSRPSERGLFAGTSIASCSSSSTSASASSSSDDAEIGDKFPYVLKLFQ